MSWDADYVSEIDYTYGYYRELSPSMLRLACLSAGVAPPEPKQLSYLELGFGQGLTLNVHAAGNPGQFWGTDFNPNHAVHAQRMTDAAGTNVRVFDDSFIEFAARSDLPEFDIIAFHGIWSWISDENRRTIVDLIRRKLKLGGIVYNSYNCVPGWAPAMPLRHIMSVQAELAGSEAGGILGKVDDSLKFVNGIVEAGAMYFKANPMVGERLKKISEQNRTYVAHEYFNTNWEVMAFSDVAKHLEDAKLTFVASASLMDHVEAINLAAPARKFLADIKHPVLYQTVRDYFINQQFRRDVFVKGAEKLTVLQRFEALSKQAVAVLTPPKDISLKVKGALGEAALQEKIYGPIFEVLADDKMAPRTLAKLAADPRLKSLRFPQLVEAIMVLVGAGHLHPAQDALPESVAHCKKLNKYICDQARTSNQFSYLASPVTGAAIPQSRFNQLFLTALQDGKQTVQGQADFAWKVLSSQGQKIVKEGKTLDKDEDNIAELTGHATKFNEKTVPVLKALRIL